MLGVKLKPDAMDPMKMSLFPADKGQPSGCVVDAGCGRGRQTMVLAKTLDTAVDSYGLFLAGLMRCARKARIDHLVQTHCMDMKDIPQEFPHIDLLWSEGKALAAHSDRAVREFAVETIKEIEAFRVSDDSYGYVFLVLQRIRKGAACQCYGTARMPSKALHGSCG